MAHALAEPLPTRCASATLANRSRKTQRESWDVVQSWEARRRRSGLDHEGASQKGAAGLAMICRKNLIRSFLTGEHVYLSLWLPKAQPPKIIGHSPLSPSAWHLSGMVKHCWLQIPNSFLYNLSNNSQRNGPLSIIQLKPKLIWVHSHTQLWHMLWKEVCKSRISPQVPDINASKQAHVTNWPEPAKKAQLATNSGLLAKIDMMKHCKDMGSKSRRRDLKRYAFRRCILAGGLDTGHKEY